MAEDRPSFLVDRCLGKGVFERLKAAGADVHFHDDHFPQNMADREWIAEATAQGWVILTKDGRMRRTDAELRAIQQAGARVVTLRSGNLRGSEMADLFEGALADIAAFVGSHPPRFVAVLYRDGSLVRRWPPDERDADEGTTGGLSPA